MYLRKDYTESDISTLHQFICDYPLGILTTAIANDKYPLIQSSHIPFILQPDSSDTNKAESNLGTLHGHMARQNPQTKALIESVEQYNALPPPGGTSQRVIEQEVLVLFNNPHHSYVTPRYYVETKPSKGTVVPTWNYAAVQAYGKACIYYAADDTTRTFLSTQLNTLTDVNEEKSLLSSDEKAWKLSDAPEKYVNLLMKNIIGISIEITRLDGKFKMSQERCPGDQEGVIAGFNARGDECGRSIASMVQSYKKS